MGIGIFAVWPLARRFGKRNVTLAGFILYAAGGMICLQMFWIIWNGRRDFEVMDWRCLSTTLLQ